MSRQREVRTVQNPALLALGARPDVLVWRQVSSLLYARDGTPVRVGVPGMADLGGIVQVTITPDMVGKTIGVAIQPECKTAKGVQQDNQRGWQQAVQQRGGIYRLIRSADDALALVEDVQRGNW